MNEKKFRMFHIYEQCKKNALEYFKEDNFEAALGIASALADLMYKLNIIHVDNELEELLNKCAQKYICYSPKNICKNYKNIVFYDEFGYDSRGLATIYLDALVENGYSVIYITRDYRKNKIYQIEKILKRSMKNKIYYLQRGTYKEETERVLDIIISNDVSVFFVYDLPQGIVGSLVANVLKLFSITSYKVNLTDHAFWLGAKATDYIIEFRDYGANISNEYRKIDAKRLLKLPFYPQINKDVAFKGYPFDAKDKKIIFSGGPLYKTFGGENKYYKIIDEILSRYENIVFWYAGQGNTTQLERLMNKYPEKVYITEEREDLYEVLRRCYFYYCTYPISGGLMGQYAVSAGKIPVALIHNDTARLLLNDTQTLCCEFFSEDKVLKQMQRFIEDEEYLHLLEKHTENQVISRKEFIAQVDRIIKQNETAYKINYQKIDMQLFIDTYLENFDETNISKIINTKRTKGLSKIENIKI